MEDVIESLRSKDANLNKISIPSKTLKVPSGQNLTHIEEQTVSLEKGPSTSQNLASPVKGTRASKRLACKASLKIYKDDRNVEGEGSSCATLPTPVARSGKSKKPSMRPSNLSQKALKTALDSTVEIHAATSSDLVSHKDDSSHEFSEPVPPVKRTKQRVTRASKLSKRNQAPDSTSQSYSFDSQGEDMVARASLRETSIEANRTYVKETQNSKESIGANSTYVKETQNSKESIGANSTYVKETQNSKESIGANSTYVKETQNSKESIGANSTYVKETQNSRESIGANSTFVKEIQNPEGGIEADERNELFNSEDFCRSKKFKTITIQKAARKSLNRAKQILLHKSPMVQISQVSTSIKPSQFYKSATSSRYRSVSQSESTHQRFHKCFPSQNCRNHKRTVSSSDQKVAVMKDLFIPRKKTKQDDSFFVRQDRLQELAAKTLQVCKKKEENLKKQTEERALLREKKRERVLSARDRNERERALLRLVREKDQLKKVQGATPQKPAEERSNFPPNLHSNVKKIAIKESPLHRLANEGLAFQAKPLAAKVLSAAASTSEHQISAKIKQFNANHTLNLQSYDVTLDPKDRQPLPGKSSDNYGLDDVNSDDSSDEETAPKKIVPKWAEAANRSLELEIQYEISENQRRIFFGSEKTTPDLTKIFEGLDRRVLIRRSSAIWTSP